MVGEGVGAALGVMVGGSDGLEGKDAVGTDDGAAGMIA